MSKKENQRVMLTKRLLKESLIAILRKKSIQQVSVTELCEAAGLNRSTFYAHYDIPSDVLADIKKEFAERMAESLRSAGGEQTFRAYLTCICEYIYENRELERIILSNSNDDEVLEAALASSFRIWGRKIPFLQVGDMDQDEEQLVMTFYYHGIFRIIREWIRRDMKKSPDEVAEILCRVLSVRE